MELLDERFWSLVSANLLKAEKPLKRSFVGNLDPPDHKLLILSSVITEGLLKLRPGTDGYKEGYPQGFVLREVSLYRKGKHFQRVKRTAEWIDRMFFPGLQVQRRREIFRTGNVVFFRVRQRFVLTTICQYNIIQHRYSSKNFYSLSAD